MTTAPAPAATDHRSLVDPLTWKLAIANLVAQIGIIVTGGLVRLTGSGLGCSTWPMCEPGQFTPVFREAESYHPFVEFGNRTLTGVLVVIAGALLWAMFTRQPVKRRPTGLRNLAFAVIGGIAIQALVGGASVIWELHPALVGSHMYISLGLVTVSAYLVARLRQADGPVFAPENPLRTVVWLLVAAAAVLLALGVVTTGTGPHSGDADAPYRFALDPLLVTRLHSGAVWVFVALLAAASHLTYRSGRDWKVWLPLMLVTVANGAVGYGQYFNGLPILLVLLHMTLAAMLAAALTIAVTQLHPRADLRDPIDAAV